MPVLSNVKLAEYDEELRPLIDELNKAGIRTLASCSGHGKAKAYIAIDLASIACRVTSSATPLGAALVIDFDLTRRFAGDG